MRNVPAWSSSSPALRCGCRAAPRTAAAPGDRWSRRRRSGADAAWCARSAAGRDWPSSRCTAALRLDLGWPSTRAAAENPPCWTTSQNNSQSRHSMGWIVHPAVRCVQWEPAFGCGPNTYPAAQISKGGKNMADDDGIFLRNTWYVAAWNHELIDGKKLARTILEKPIVLYRGASGKVVALDDRCCHRAAPLVDGPHRGRRYPLHVSRHEVRSRRQVHPDPGPGHHSRQSSACAAIPWSRSTI